MDVSIKISLQGGHVWEFTCDEDNPIVFGLVSALPGASLDSALPPDGLIQVEAKSGERLFVTRSSLVAVTIRRLATGAADIPAGGHAAVADAPFTLQPGFFDEAAIAALLAEARPLDEAGSRGGMAELALETLPPAALDRLVGCLEAAQGAGMPATDIHLDLRLFAAGDDVGEFPLPWADDGGRLALLMHLPLAGEGASALAVAFDGADATGRTVAPRNVVLEPNCVLLFRPEAVGWISLLTRRGKGSRALIISGVLRDGAGHAGG